MKWGWLLGSFYKGSGSALKNIPSILFQSLA